MTQQARRTMYKVHLALASLVCLIVYVQTGPPMQAATVPTGFTETLVASGLSSPTAMQFAPDGRLFVAEQGGRLRVIKDGVLLPTPFLTVTVSSVGERGLLGVAFDPQFATNHFVYVYYTATTPAIHNRISRFTANGDVAVAGSEKILLELNNLSSATNHNGGALAFGPDGKLYAAVGENANGAHAQTLANLHRQDAAHQPGSRTHRPGAPDAHSDGQPVLRHGDRQEPSRSEALGLRNPFTFAFNPAQTRIFINDVGQNTWEEINDGLAGANYGWPNTEGNTTNPAIRQSETRLRSLVAAAPSPAERSTPRPRRQFPSEYLNDYFFADYCSGLDSQARSSGRKHRRRRLRRASTRPVDLKVADDGSLYYLARGIGRFDRRGLSNLVRRRSAQHHDRTPPSQSVAPGAIGDLQRPRIGTADASLPVAAQRR